MNFAVVRIQLSSRNIRHGFAVLPGTLHQGAAGDGRDPALAKVDLADELCGEAQILGRPTLRDAVASDLGDRLGEERDPVFFDAGADDLVDVGHGGLPLIGRERGVVGADLRQLLDETFDELVESRVHKAR